MKKLKRHTSRVYTKSAGSKITDLWRYNEGGRQQTANASFKLCSDKQNEDQL